MRRSAAAVALALLLVGVATYFAGEQTEVAVLRSFDADGTAHETKLWVVDHADAAWVRVANPKRHWYRRLVANPRAELVRAGHTQTLVAEPSDDPGGPRRHRWELPREVRRRGLVVRRAAAPRSDSDPAAAHRGTLIRVGPPQARHPHRLRPGASDGPTSEASVGIVSKTAPRPGGTIGAVLHVAPFEAGEPGIGQA